MFDSKQPEQVELTLKDAFKLLLDNDKAFDVMMSLGVHVMFMERFVQGMTPLLEEEPGPSPVTVLHSLLDTYIPMIRDPGVPSSTEVLLIREICDLFETHELAHTWLEKLQAEFESLVLKIEAGQAILNDDKGAATGPVMLTYNYEATDAKRNEFHGYIDATSEEEAHVNLRLRGYSVTQLKKASTRPAAPIM